MKQKLFSLCAAAILVLSLASCAGDDTTTKQTTELDSALQTTEIETTIQAVNAAKSEGFTAKCKQAYLSIIKYYEQMRGKYRHESYESDSGLTEEYHDGVVFCDLFDWDLNGTPELIVGYASSESNPCRVSAIEIYTYVNGNVQLILKEVPRHSYFVLDRGEMIYFSRSSDGNLVMRIDDVINEWSASDSNYYQYDGTAVSVKKLSFYGTKTDDGEFISCDYFINGIPCTKDEYTKCETYFNGKDFTEIDIKAYDYSDIISYLSGKSDSCKHLMLKNDKMPQWFSQYLAF